jgi:hypothetical protein
MTWLGPSNQAWHKEIKFKKKNPIKLCEFLLPYLSHFSLSADSLKLGLQVSICLDMVSTVQKMTSRPSKSLDSSKNNIWTSLDMVYALKSRFVSIFNTVLIKTLNLNIFKTLSQRDEKSQSRSRLVLTVETPRLIWNTFKSAWFTNSTGQNFWQRTITKSAKIILVERLLQFGEKRSNI